MVPNQRQLIIVVFDWGSYLGSHFPFCVGGFLSMCSCLSALICIASRVILLFWLVCSVFILNIIKIHATNVTFGHIHRSDV